MLSDTTLGILMATINSSILLISLPVSVAAHLSAQTQAVLVGKTFFPHLILPAFQNGLGSAYYVSAGMTVIASLLRGKRYIHGEDPAHDSVHPRPFRQAEQP